MSGASLNDCVSVDASIVHGAKVRAFPLGQANSGINPERPMGTEAPNRRYLGSQAACERQMKLIPSEYQPGVTEVVAAD